MSDVSSGGWVCRECWASGPVKANVVHTPGCILWGHSRDELAALDAPEIKSGESI